MSRPELGEELSKLRSRAKLVGVDLRYVVDNSEARGGARHEYRADELILSTSVGKVAFAAMIAETFSPDHEVIITRHVPGSGRFDDPNSRARSASVEDLYVDMLQNSGNTGFAMLADQIGSAGSINEFYHSYGWDDTRVIEDDEGRILMDTTTPNEALDQLEYMAAMEEKGYLYRLGVDALRHSAADAGTVRSVFDAFRGVELTAKPGSYPGDKLDPHAFRNESGILTAGERRLGYALMTQSPMWMRGVFAEPVIEQAGVEMVRALGPDAEKALKAKPRVTGSVRRAL